MKTRLISIVSMVTLLIGTYGCAVNQVPQGYDNSRRDQDSNIELMQEIHTRLPIKQAAEDVSRCLQKFGFNVGYTGNTTYFFSEVQASSEDSQYPGVRHQQNTTVSFRWVKDGDTNVTILSNLDKAQFDYVAAAVQKAVDGGEPTTAP